jgi:hypothetical protein
MFRNISIRFIITTVCFGFFLSAPVTAATLIEINSEKEGFTQVLLDNNNARVTTTQEQSYTIIDYKKQTMHVVLPNQKQIMDMSGELPSKPGKAASEVKVTVTPMGKGPEIAGYSTMKFGLKANGKNCGIIFGSVDAMKVTGIDKFLAAMDKFQKKQLTAMGSYADMMDSCDRVEMSMPGYSKTVGLSLREVDKNGGVDHEVTRINTEAPLPVGAFSLPKNYKKVTLADQMKQAEQGMQGMPSNNSDMEKMMKQMQQSGDMSPEALEKMKSFQEIMKQKK